MQLTTEGAQSIIWTITLVKVGIIAAIIVVVGFIVLAWIRRDNRRKNKVR